MYRGPKLNNTCSCSSAAPGDVAEFAKWDGKSASTVMNAHYIAKSLAWPGIESAAGYNQKSAVGHFNPRLEVPLPEGMSLLPGYFSLQLYLTFLGNSGH